MEKEELEKEIFKMHFEKIKMLYDEIKKLDKRIGILEYWIKTLKEKYERD